MLKNAPKTLVIVATTDLATDQRLQRMAEALHGAGWQVTLLGRHLARSPALLPQPFRQIRLRLAFTRGPLFYLAYNLRICLWLFFHHPHAITACDADTLPGAWLAAWLRGSKLVFDAHEYFSQVPEVVRRARVQRIWAWIENTFIPKTDAAYTVGPALAQVFTSLYRRPFGLVRNLPRQQDYAKIARNPVANRIIYTGALNEGRGLEELLHALILLPNNTAFICGDGPLKEHLMALVNQLGLQQRVRFTGSLSPAQLRMELAQSWLGFSLLRPVGESYRLSLSNKFFDYIQAGLPQLCPNLPEYEAVLQDFPVGLAVSCRAEAIVEAISRIGEADRYAGMAAACSQAAKRYNWEQEKRSLIALYADI